MSDTPRTDAAIDKAVGGLYPDGTDGVTVEEDAFSNLHSLCRQLERELAAIKAIYNRINTDILNILQNHSYRHETAADTLKRIILERNALQAALKKTRANP